MNNIKKVGIVGTFILITFITTAIIANQIHIKQSVKEVKTTVLEDKEEIPSSDATKEEEEIKVDVLEDSVNVIEDTNTKKANMVDDKTTKTKQENKVVNVYLKEIEEPIKEPEVVIISEDVDTSIDDKTIFELKDSASEKWKTRMKTIDKYDSLILDVAKQEQVNPQMLKIII